MEKERNALDYIRWRGDFSIDRDPLNEVDMLLCAMVSTPSYDEILKPDMEMKLSLVAEKYFALHPNIKKTDLGALQSGLVLPTLKEMGTSERFRDCVLTGSAKTISIQTVEQFEAVTLLVSEDLMVVSYRGTDDTLVGWKENCYLAIDHQVAAQKDAVHYLTALAEAYPEKKIITVGHSKGGNLAIYAAVHADPEIQKRIVLVYGFDSPGFMDDFFLTEGYQRIKDRIVTVLTQHSLVGVMMIPAGRYHLIHSNVSGPMAHDCYHWEVERNSFVTEEQMSDFSLTFSRALYDTIKQLSREQMISFVDQMFEILQEKGASTVTDLTKIGSLRSILTLAKLASNEAVSTFVSQLMKRTEVADRHLIEIRKEAERSYKSIFEY